MSIHGEYWWVRVHAKGVDWAHCFAGESMPRQQGTVADISGTPAPSGARLVICIPGERARTHKVNLPQRNRKRFLEALPFALEDQLLHEAASYHMVPIPADKGAQDIPVVVIEHVWLSGLLEKCKLSGWYVSLVIPDYLAIPVSVPGSWFMDASTSPLLLRMAGHFGAVLTGEAGAQTIGTLLLALEQASPSPETLRVRVSSPQQYKMVSAWSETLSSRNIQLDVYLEELPRSAWLARQPLMEEANLLTGPYVVKDPLNLGMSRLKPSVAMTAALMLVIAINWFVTSAKLQTEHSQLKQSIEASYRQAFPDTQNLVDPRFQMEEQIKRIKDHGQQGAAADFLARLEQLSTVLAGEPDYRVQKINYDGTDLTLEVSVADYESLDRLQGQLARIVLVSVENAELKDGRVYGRVRLGGQA